ncbi:uncharacterized protein LOC133035512 [Cannabis sativa]|uniref:uncharacterized protein LOC133035512 n=1 Tax=Cannabis sativa TaxID=3483 RepID=UPI0029CA691E|nr:uncharacterized protein LOC133035512 [Cannabis sativa]
MLAAESRKKSYVDPKSQEIDFQIRDMVFLQVTPMKGIKCFVKKGKLSQRSIEPFEILERIGQVAYRLAKPPALAAVHDAFHVLMLQNYVSDSSHILSYEALEL